ncbi:cytochrome c [Thermus tengchongensis]|uniref:Sulfide dehydrogenase n=1 Tax=Thermus tengchongensis TaxID=1214928 RepID=A0ABY2K936_9DEIN|nr:cytochrome c [Thermus tengchongensis]TFU17751.1 sulfide dehydrogenase [Thermus tengchongensis]
MRNAKKLIPAALLAALTLVMAQQESGVVLGNYAQGTLGNVLQPAPVQESGGSTYRVGAWPLYTPDLPDGPGKDLVLSYCQVCHSVTYIPMQPPLPAATWEAEVNKMIKTFGAQIPEDAAKQIVAYLQAHFTPETRKQ